MAKDAIFTAAGPVSGAPYSPAVKVGGTVFVSGQIPLDPATGKVVEGGFAEQATQVLENLKAVLAEAGLELKDIVKTTVFLIDLANFPELNKVYGAYFPEGVKPARSTVQVSRLPLDVMVEIEAIAVVE